MFLIPTHCFHPRKALLKAPKYNVVFIYFLDVDCRYLLHLRLVNGFKPKGAFPKFSMKFLVAYTNTLNPRGLEGDALVLNIFLKVDAHRHLRRLP